MGLGCQPCEAFGPTAPASPIDGALWVDSSTGPPYQLKRWNLAAGAWQAVGATTTVGGGGAQGFLVPITTPPAAATWTWVNQGGATRSDTTAGLVLDASVSTAGITCLVRANPATPWTRTIAIAPVWDAATPTGAGFVFRDSASGKLELHGWDMDTAGVHQNWTNPTTFSSSPFGTVAARNSRTPLGLNWLRCGDDGTNRTIDVTADGSTWLHLFTVGRTSFLTADQHGVWLRTGGHGIVTLVSWL